MGRGFSVVVQLVEGVVMAAAKEEKPPKNNDGKNEFASTSGHAPAHESLTQMLNRSRSPAMHCMHMPSFSFLAPFLYPPLLLLALSLLQTQRK